jgi:hypothetical protein
MELSRSIPAQLFGYSPLLLWALVVGSGEAVGRRVRVETGVRFDSVGSGAGACPEYTVSSRVKSRFFIFLFGMDLKVAW